MLLLLVLFRFGKLTWIWSCYSSHHAIEVQIARKKKSVVSLMLDTWLQKLIFRILWEKLEEKRVKKVVAMVNKSLYQSFLLLIIQTMVKMVCQMWSSFKVKKIFQNFSKRKKDRKVLQKIFGGLINDLWTTDTAILLVGHCSFNRSLRVLRNKVQFNELPVRYTIILNFPHILSLFPST